VRRADRNGVDGFLSRFVGCHAGYAGCRPDLLPMLIPKSTAEAVWGATRECLEGLRNIVERRLELDGGGVLEDLGHGAEARWLEGMPATEAPSLYTAFARADFVLGAEGPRLVEMNVGPTISGIGIMDRYADLAQPVIGPDAARDLALPRPARAWADC